MEINVILAGGPSIANRLGIGYANALPWRLKGDLKRFKDLTMGKVVIMGRVTFETLPKPLEDRTIVVISEKRAKDYKRAMKIDPVNWRDHLDWPKASLANNVFFMSSLPEALDFLERAGHDDVWVAGGQALYEEALKLPCFIWLTLVCKDPEPGKGYDTWVAKDWFAGALRVGENEVVFEKDPNSDLEQISHVYQQYISKAKLDLAGNVLSEHYTKFAQHFGDLHASGSSQRTSEVGQAQDTNSHNPTSQVETGTEG